MLRTESVGDIRFFPWGCVGKSGGDGQGSTQILGWGLWCVLGGRWRSKGLLGGVDHVEEAVLVLLALVHLGDGRGHAHHAVPVHQQEEGLVGVELQASPGEGSGERGTKDRWQRTVLNDSGKVRAESQGMV